MLSTPVGNSINAFLKSTTLPIKTAKDAGHVKINGHEFAIDKIQIITIEELLTGKQPQLPGGAENKTFKKAQRNEEKSVSKGLFD